MKLTIDLSPAQAERLRHEADRLGLAPEDLARAAIVDLLATPGDDCDSWRCLCESPNFRGLCFDREIISISVGMQYIDNNGEEQGYPAPRF